MRGERGGSHHGREVPDPGEEALEPGPDRVAHGALGPQGVVAAHGDDLAVGGGRRDPEAIGVAGHREHRDARRVDGVDLGPAASSGNASVSTPTGGGAAATAPRHATRAPDDRPPWICGVSGKRSVSAASTQAQDSSSWAAGAGALRPATR